MTTIVMPTSPGFISRKWGLMGNTQVFQSPFTKSVQTYNLTGTRFLATWTLPRMKIEVAAPWMAFFAQLEGMGGRFYASPPNANARGEGGGLPKVKGAGQVGSTLLTDGWPNATTVLLKGDYVELANGELKMVTADVVSDGSGNASISIKPSLRNSPDDNSDLTINSVKCKMMLSGDDQGQWTRDNLKLYEMTFSAVEVWEA